MILSDPVPENLQFFPGLEKMRALRPEDQQAEAVLLLDCGEARRTGTWLEGLLPGKKYYCIDHHQSNAFQGDYAVVEPKAAAASEIVAAIAREAGILPTADVAMCLYAGIVGDTGCFRFLNTTPRTMDLAAWLMPQVDREIIRIKLFESRSYASMKMVAACYNNFQVECDGKLCYTFVTEAERDAVGATPGDCHDVVNGTLALSGVQVGIMFEEYHGYVKMSFRARRAYAVDELAKSFGGGGHKQASGCKINGTLAEVMPKVLQEARKLFA